MKVNWDDNRNPIFLEKLKIDGNHSPPTSNSHPMDFITCHGIPWVNPMQSRKNVSPGSPGTTDVCCFRKLSFSEGPTKIKKHPATAAYKKKMLHLLPNQKIIWDILNMSQIEMVISLFGDDSPHPPSNHPIPIIQPVSSADSKCYPISMTPPVMNW